MESGNNKTGSTNKIKTTAIVLAGGRGTRMNSKTPKQYLDICGKPVLYYSLKAFEDSEVQEIILVTGKDDLDYCRTQIVEKYGLHKVSAIVEGGRERYDSVYNGLKLAGSSDYVLIHDGARPFLTQQIISDNILAVQTKNACVTGVPSKDTVKLSDGQGCVADTPDRSRVWIVQTPQTFAVPVIREAYDKIMQMDCAHVTDDAMVVETALGLPVYFVMGDYRNIKITTPEDLKVAQVFVEDFVESYNIW